MCSCKNRKVEYTCDKMRSENIVNAPCNDECEERKRAAEEENKRRIEIELEKERIKNLREIEEYEKKFGPKKYKERKQKIIEVKKNNTKLYIYIVSAVFAIASAVFLSLYN